MAKKKPESVDDPITFTPAPELAEAAAETERAAPAAPAQKEVASGSGAAEGPLMTAGPLTGASPEREQSPRSPKHGDVPLGSGAANPPVFAGPLGVAESMAEKAVGKTAKRKKR